MAEQCIVCLDPLLHAEEPPPAPDEAKHTPDSAITSAIIGDTTSQDGPVADGAGDCQAHPDLHSVHDCGSICHENDNVAVIQICGHTLHDGCLRAWSGKANSCPICRQVFHSVRVYDKIGGNLLSSYKVEDKKQVAEFDAQAWLDEYNEAEAEEISTPCPICNLADHEEVLLLCDGCDTPYHTHCIGLESVPEGAWFCMECVDLFGQAVQAPGEEDRPFSVAARRANRAPNDFFPRTRYSMRRARRRARSDEWQGAWGQITGRIWDVLNIDLDHDEDDSLEDFRRAEQYRNNERREFERWQERLDIARRLGAQDFERNIPSAILQRTSRRAATPQTVPVQQTREEIRSWGAFERARDCDVAVPVSRKRKARSVTASPVEPVPEPERKLKRPRTRRITALPGEASSSKPAAPVVIPVPASSSTSMATTSTPQANGEPRSFLSSLLKEVESSTPSDDEHIRSLFGESRPTPAIDPSSPAGSSPAGSPHNSPRMSATPPPHRTLRPSSPTLLSSHIEPIYPPANYSPTRASNQKDHTAEPAGVISGRNGAGAAASPVSDHSDNENNNNLAVHSNGIYAGQVFVAEIRQPRPRRKPTVALPRSEDVSPSRNPLSLEMKESISGIVRSALKPHWKSSQLTADQYAAINRDVSHKLYEEVTDPATADAEVRRLWEMKASKEVERAVADLQA